MKTFKQILHESLNSDNLDEAGRCWKGFKPVSGKEPYSKGSCVREEGELNEDDLLVGIGKDDIHEESEYEGKKVTLNKPFRTPGGPKKFSVYVKNDKGNVVKVNFGDPNMSIKRDDSERRKNFRARHKCSERKDKTSAGYWSCKMWSKASVSSIINKK